MACLCRRVCTQTLRGQLEQRSAPLTSSESSPSSPSSPRTQAASWYAAARASRSCRSASRLQIEDKARWHCQKPGP